MEAWIQRWVEAVDREAEALMQCWAEALKEKDCKLVVWQLICNDCFCLVCCPRRLLELSAPLALWPVGVRDDRCTEGHTLDVGRGSRMGLEH